MPLDVLGYSERGMVNALVYEMKYSEDGLERLRHVLGLCVFDPPRQWSPLKHAKIYIEQSFSGFGDLDLLILFQEQTDKNHALFLEAKVKTAGRVRWNIGDEWQKFKDLAADRLSDSNLFIQLYRKVQLARRLREGRQQLPEADDLSLGSNPVVRRATEDLAAYCGNAWFVALVPDSPENLQQFFQDTVRLFRPVEAGLDLPDWDANGWGYLPWTALNDLCHQLDNRWPELRRNFDHNREQVFSAQRKTAVWDEGTIEDFVRGLSQNQQTLLRVLAQAEGQSLRQGALLQQLNYQGSSRSLQRVKAGVNRACLDRNLDPLLPEGTGAGDERVHRINKAPDKLIHRLRQT